MGGFDPRVVSSEDRHLACRLALIDDFGHTDRFVTTARKGVEGSSIDNRNIKASSRVVWEMGLDLPGALARIQDSVCLDRVEIKAQKHIYSPQPSHGRSGLCWLVYSFGRFLARTTDQNKVKIGIDARFLTHPQVGGFKTYTENLISALAEVDAEHEYILYLDRLPCQETKLPDCPNFTSRVVPGQAPIIGMPWREQVGLARQVARDRLDLLHAPSLTAPLRLACPLVVTIHDIIWLFPEKFSKGKSRSTQRKLMERYYRIVPKLAARHASAIITVSQSAKESIIQYLGLAPEHVLVTHEAASQLYRRVDDLQQIEAIRLKYHLPSEFILAIGSADPRKNMIRLVQAYALLPALVRERYKLVIVWTHHFLAVELAEQVEKLGLTNQTHFLRQISNEELVLLYNGASLFVFPSLYEGFGLPLLEAMACGTPVVASNNSSISEIVGDAALLVDAEDEAAIAELMAKVLVDETLQQDLIKRGLNRTLGFSWEKCGRETLEVYKKVFSAASRNNS